MYEDLVQAVGDTVKPGHHSTAYLVWSKKKNNNDVIL